MHYKKLLVITDEVQGESFSRDLKKQDGSIWETEEGAYYQFVNKGGTVLDTDTLTKSGDDLYLTFHVANTVTADITGDHTLFVRATNTGEATFDDVIAEYRIEYKEARAT